MVRHRFAKPLFVGSIPTSASIVLIQSLTADWEEIRTGGWWSFPRSPARNACSLLLRGLCGLCGLLDQQLGDRPVEPIGADRLLPLEVFSVAFFREILSSDQCG